MKLIINCNIEDNNMSAELLQDLSPLNKIIPKDWRFLFGKLMNFIKL